jgi:thymidine kinase
MSGEITVITGPMFSSKTETLLASMRRAAVADIPYQLFKSSVDHRYSTDDVVSHSGISMAATNVNSSEHLVKLINPETKVIGLDEAQFLDNGLVDVVLEHADRGLVIILSGLSQDSQRKPYGPLAKLLPHATNIILNKAICKVCKKYSAEFSYRRGFLKNVSEQLLVGGAESYEARCRD